MTQLKDSMSNIEKIRQEIERRKKENMYVDLPMSIGRYYEDRDILAFLDSLPEETCKDSLQVQEICKENPDSFTRDLEAAAEKYADGEMMSGLAERAFIDEAKWQANQLLKGSPLPEDTVLFQKGVEEGKRLMMEEAVEGEIGYWNQRGLSIRLDKSLEKLGYGEDTEVRIIIVKQ